MNAGTISAFVVYLAAMLGIGVACYRLTSSQSEYILGGRRLPLIGRARMYVQDILKLGPGAVVPLESLTGDPLDLYVNDRLVARGEVLVINENFAIRITEVISPQKAQEK